ncbi:unnamed protein product [Paramecium octaurelia]|uniref:Transmembrane protein n=1 Tax=Paramecium octaurelia TaxID=43137 RepID=A0A8S1YIH1_PAROT|nr:unnamed protein product [Paramecium octaurelia]
MNIIKQINQKGIRLHSKWQEANERITQYIKLSKKQQQLPIFFQCIFLLIRIFYWFIIEMNQPGKEIMMRNQAKKMNDNLLLRQRINQNTQKAMLYLKKISFKKQLSYARRFLREEPFYRHALYNRCDLYKETTNSNCNWFESIFISNFKSSTVLVVVQKVFTKLLFWVLLQNITMLINRRIDNLYKYDDTIFCYDKAIQIDLIFCHCLFQQRFVISWLYQVIYQKISGNTHQQQRITSRQFSIVNQKRMNLSVFNYEIKKQKMNIFISVIQQISDSIRYLKIHNSQQCDCDTLMFQIKTRLTVLLSNSLMIVLNENLIKDNTI